MHVSGMPIALEQRAATARASALTMVKRRSEVGPVFYTTVAMNGRPCMGGVGVGERAV